MRGVATIGVYGWDITSFLAALRAVDVGMVVRDLGGPPAASRVTYAQGG
jgi:hypothetical protein